MNEDPLADCPSAGVEPNKLGVLADVLMVPPKRLEALEAPNNGVLEPPNMLALDAPKAGVLVPKSEGVLAAKL